MSLFGNLFNDDSKKVDVSKRFNLIARVGQGSMSRVWRAEDTVNGEAIAVKVLDKEKTRKFEARFPGLNKPSEGEIAQSLHHPYIVKTREVGITTEDEMYLVMDYVEGSGLSLLVDLQNDQMARYRTRYLIQIGESLEYFHKKQFIHRDICPRNIMVTQDNNIRLIDFGLTVPNTPDFKKPGNRTGTANYMAPELIKRRPTDQRIDIFSYSVTCYEMYAKRHPWDAALTLDAVTQHINKPPIVLKELVPGIDDQIQDTIMKGLETNPDDRWQRVSDMVAEFRKAEARLVKATRLVMKPEKRRSVDSKTKPSASDKSGSLPPPSVDKMPAPAAGTKRPKKSKKKRSKKKPESS